MQKNRLAAFLFRVSALAAALSGLLTGCGFGEKPARILFYTTLSNILIAGLFLYLAVRTGIDLFRKGLRGRTGYCPRLQMALTLVISFTFLVFWTLCAPFGGGMFRLWTYGNLAVHLITPVLAVADYFLLGEPGHLKKRDIFLSVLIPASYIAFVSALSFGNIVFYFDHGVPRHAPYPFMDLHGKAALTLVFILISTTLFLLLAFLLYRLDTKRKAR